MGYFYVMLSALLFGLNGSLTKILVGAGISPAQLTFFRVLGTGILAGALLLISNRDAFRINLRQLATMAVLGIAGVALLQFGYTAALALIQVGVVLLFEYMAVLMIPLVAFFVLKEKVRARLWVAIAFVIAGMAVVAEVWASSLNPLGAFLAFSSAVSLTIYYVVGEKVLDRTPPLVVAFWTMLFAAIFWAVFSGWWQVKPAFFSTMVSLGGILAEMRLPFWILLIWIIIAGSFLPFIFSFLALRRLTATATSLVASSELVFAFVFAWVWLGEELSPVQIVGAVVVVVGITLAQTARVSKVFEEASVSGSEDLGFAPVPLARDSREFTEHD